MTKKTLILALCLLLAALPAAAAPAWSDGKTTLAFFGQSAFTISRGDAVLVIDPYLTGNPLAPIGPNDLSPNYILVTHAHQDHLGDTVAIAKRTGAKVITTAEIARMLRDQGCEVIPMSIGGKKKFDFGYVRVTPAVHGAGIAGGIAAGFIINFYGTTVYHAGDTSLFGDMALLAQLEKIDYALLPIGDNYTMGPDDAALAVGMLKPKTVVPMHYNANPLIMQSPETFKAAVEAKYGVPVRIMKPGDMLAI